MTVEGWKKQKNFWAVVDSKGRFILDEGRLPIFYLKRIAQDKADEWGFNSKAIKISINQTPKQ